MRRSWTRRAALAGGLAALGAAGTATFRLHGTPRQGGGLAPARLEAALSIEGQGPRILFVGNSILLQHDVPGRVAALAAEADRPILPVVAAASGARLVETLRLPGFRRLVRQGQWSAIVLQDFTKTPLRACDRWGSLLAMASIARMAEAPGVLVPPWPEAPGGGVYRHAGRFTATPDDPADFARRTLLHYAAAARFTGYAVAPLPERWLALGLDPALYEKDLHHASPAGAALAAEVLWETLARVLLPNI